MLVQCMEIVGHLSVLGTGGTIVSKTEKVPAPHEESKREACDRE